MEIVRDAQSPDAASRKIDFGSCDWLNCRKLNSFLVEKVASGREVTLAPWTGEWPDTPEPRLLWPHSRHNAGCDAGHCGAEEGDGRDQPLCHGQLGRTRPGRHAG